jgi:glutamyl-Q tRNA(Asp) synthetase
VTNSAPVDYRGRFAPTPSGPLHFGSLVAAVGSYLEAKVNDGEWRLRIDDLDPPRVAPGAVDAILRCLAALGFEWDGAVVFQSRRWPAYHAALHRLLRLGALYPCACSRKEIAESGLAGIDGPIYPGTCRRGLPPGRPARALRLRVADGSVTFDDGQLGPQHRELAREAGDFIVYRAGGAVAFHLASAIDESEMGITHVVRGADLLESSARQIHMLSLLDLPIPRYTHLPVAVDGNGEKLSKQTRAAPVDTARPVPVLCAVLRFLAQDVPSGLDREPLTQLWRHAIDHWDLQRVGTRLRAPVPR